MNSPNAPVSHHSSIPSVAAILLGLVVAQVIATLQVYISNADLHRTLLVLKEAGYISSSRTSRSSPDS